MKRGFRDIAIFFKNKYLLSLISNGTNAIIGMLTLSILLRALTIKEMGDWGFFLTTLLFFDTFRSGFLSTAFVKFYAGSEDVRKNNIVGASWFIALAITGIFALVNIPLYFFSNSINDPGIKLFLHFFSLSYILSLPFFMANCLLQAKQRFDLLLFLNFSSQGSFLFFIIGVILLGHININTVVYCYLASNILSSGISLICGWTEFNKIKFSSRKVIKELYDFGKFSVGTNMTSSLSNVITTFVIKFFLGAASLAVYNAGTKLIQIVELPLRSMVYAAMPTLSASYNTGNKTDVIVLTKKYIGLLTFALLPVCLLTCVFSEYAVLILGGKKYILTEAPNILSICMIITLLFPAERFLAVALDVVHLPKINFIKILVVMFVSFVTELAAVYLTQSLYGLVCASVFSIFTSLYIAYSALNKYYLRFSFWDIFTNGYVESVIFLKRLYAKRFR